jgi:hypothetical protein
MFGVDDMLIRVARRVLDGVLSQFAAQMRTVEDMAMNPLKAIVQQVVGGVWTGEGADAFVNEVNSIAIPSVGQVGQQINTMNVNVQFARDVIEQADEEGNRLIESRITDTFKFY